MSTDNPFAPPNATVADVSTHAADPAPRLWNPNAAASWSLLFSPLFGAFIHMKNWQVLGEPEKAANAKNWALASLLFFVVVVVLAVVMPESKAVDAIRRFAGFGLLIAWYYASGKAQNAFVLARFGPNYPRKGWLKPLLLALAAVVGFFILGAILGAISAVFQRVG